MDTAVGVLSGMKVLIILRTAWGEMERCCWDQHRSIGKC